MHNAVMDANVLEVVSNIHDRGSGTSVLKSMQRRAEAIEKPPPPPNGSRRCTQ